MSALVETMAYRGEKPWHGLGFELPAEVGVDGMLDAAGLKWTVIRRPVYVNNPDGSSIHVPDTYALVRDTDGKVLASCGRVYKPVQNAEAFEFFRRFVEAGSATLETAGSLDDGRYVWGLANLHSGFKLGADGSDESKGYLLVGNPHKPGRALIIKHTMIRVVCWNTLTSALAGVGQEFRMSHRQVFDAATRELAERTLGIAREQTEAFRLQAEALSKVTMAFEDVVKTYRGVYQSDWKDGDDMNRPMNGVLLSYATAPGAQPGTAWGVLNGATHFEDHAHGRNQSSRLKSSWMGQGERNKAAVLDTLLVGAGLKQAA